MKEMQATCYDYEDSLKECTEKVQDREDKVENGMDESKLKELRNPWKQEQEEEKVKFSEVVQDSTQELDKEVEEIIRLGRFSEGDKRPMKVRMIRKGNLADDT
ncbi:hypothetical protein E2C01_091728 [Portunus trituberculatus]|uniref:Uncharacterized protein n=1 Tax=Portunus trituberculatus TaxID=210409 RepID=A0A5B7JQ55_PORTR|nr:hypothetical protein [Portunus trituberculatus]